MKEKTSTAQPLRSLLLGAVGLACTVVFFQGMRIFLLNYEYFDISLEHAAVWLAVATLLLILAIAAPILALRLRRYELYSALIYGAAFFAWFKASFLNWDYGLLFAGVDIDWGRYHALARMDVAALALILGGSVLARQKVQQHSGTLIAFLLIVQASSVVALTPLADRGRRAEIFDRKTVRLLERKTEKFSRSSNILVLIIDTLQSDVVSELLTSERQKKLRGFTFFRDTAAPSSLTTVSIPNALTGTLFDNQVPYARYLKSAYRSPGSLLGNLIAAGYFVELIPWGRATPIPLDTTLISNGGGPGFQPNLYFLQSILAAASFSTMPQFLQQRMHHYVLEAIFDVFDPGAGSNIRFIQDTARLPVELLDQPVAKIIHLRGPHIPLLGYGRHALNYDDAARAAAAMDRPTSVEFTRDNYTRVAAVMLDAVIAYLSKLENAGVYDRSAIFVLGDHGAGRQGLRFRVPANWPAKGVTISSNMQSGAAAALLVKAPGAGQPFSISDTPAALSDVACTVNSSILGKTRSKCHSLLIALPEPRRERVFIEFGNSRFDARGYLPPMTEYVITPPMWQVASWRPTGRKLLPGTISKARFAP